MFSILLKNQEVTRNIEILVWLSRYIFELFIGSRASKKPMRNDKILQRKLGARYRSHSWPDMRNFKPSKKYTMIVISSTSYKATVISKVQLKRFYPGVRPGTIRFHWLLVSPVRPIT